MLSVERGHTRHTFGEIMKLRVDKADPIQVHTIRNMVSSHAFPADWLMRMVEHRTVLIRCRWRAGRFDLISVDDISATGSNVKAPNKNIKNNCTGGSYASDLFLI